MKAKILLVVAFILFAIPTFAQRDSSKYILKGQWVGGASLSYSSFTNGKNPGFKASSSIGHLVGKRLAFGIDVSYFQRDNTLESELPYTYSLLSGSVFSRLYIRVKRFAPYAEIHFGGVRSVQDGFQKVTNSQKFYKAGIGFNYFLSPVLAFNFTFSRTYFPDFVYYNYSSAYKQTGDVSRSLNLGFQIYLSRNQRDRLDQDNFLFPQKGTWLLGGTIAGGEGSNRLRGYGELIFNAEGGIFLSRKFVLGIRLANLDIAEVMATSVNVYNRYYLLAKRLAPFAELSVGFGSASTDATYYYYPRRFGNSIFLQAGLGANYFVTNSIAIESKLSLDSFVDPMISIQTGFQFFVARKK